MNFSRKAHQSLLAWKQRSTRKPLLLRGARQVGKTTLVTMFATEFTVFLNVNLEREEDRAIFERTDSVRDILNAIYLLKEVSPKPGSTLLFVDEIQESPKAIQLLRYFYEEMPELHVIAAGSLLEFSLKEVPSFPVGRIEYLCLHPLDFEEYLIALDYKMATEQLSQVPVAEFAHATLLKLFHEYAIIGSMPEVVQLYAQTKNIASIKPVYERLWQSYKDDVEKYAKNNTERNVIRHIIDTAAHEHDRIKFEKFGKSNYRSREVGEAMRTLEMAKVIQMIYPTTSLQPPIITDFKKRPRLQLLDTGLLNQALGLQGEMIGIKDLSDFYRGKVIQHLVTQQVIAIRENPSYKPHFWVRESKDANSEVDLVFQQSQYVVPIEIKSGEQGRLRSLHQFVERSNHPYAVRLDANPLKVEKSVTPAGKEYLLLNLPYYNASKLPQYIQWFIENHKL
ncbi:MAG: ATP-binding protein [Cytophagales bacterium]|nr:ATP-binding protein [Cytophagales bacterium]